MRKSLLLLFIAIGPFAFAQVGLGTITPDLSSQVDIEAFDKGVLFPRIALTDIYDQTTITNGNVVSLFVYNTSNNTQITPGYYYWDGSRWQKLINGDDIPDDEDIITYLVQNDGQYTYTNEAGDITTINVPRVGSGDPNLATLNAIAGDIYVDNATGALYTYNGTTWVQPNAETLTTLLQNNGQFIYTDEAGNATVFNVSQSGNGDPNTNGTLGVAGDVYVDTTTGDIYTYDGGTWVQQGLETLTTLIQNFTDGTITYVDEAGSTTTLKVNPINGLHNDNGDIKLGGDLIEPTLITTDATNTLAIDGLEDGDVTQDYVLLSEANTNIVRKIKVEELGANLIQATITALDGDTTFATPMPIVDPNNAKIQVYRNGVNIAYTITGGSVTLLFDYPTTCFDGDQIKIVQHYN